MRSRQRKTTNVKPHYVLCRQTGNEILVTSENAMEYRDSVKYIRLQKPVQAETKSPIRPAAKEGESPPIKKRAAGRKKTAAKKTATAEN